MVASADADWSKTCEAFRRIAAREGLVKIAEEIPAHHATVYRLVRGDTQHPSRAVRAGIERIVEEHKNED